MDRKAEIAARIGTGATAFVLKYSTALYRISTDQLGSDLGWPMNEPLEIGGLEFATGNEAEKFALEVPSSAMMAYAFFGENLGKTVKGYLAKAAAGIAPFIGIRIVGHLLNIPGAEPITQIPSSLVLIPAIAGLTYVAKKIYEMPSEYQK